VDMQESHGLAMDLLLEPGLGGGCGGEVADALGGDGVFCEGVGEAFADFGGVGELGWGWWGVGVPSGCQ